MRYIGVGRRAVALILDLLIILALGGWPIWLGGSTIEFTTTNTNTPEFSMAGPSSTSFHMAWNPWMAVLLAVLPFAYFTLLEGFFGATAGKMLLGLRVVRLDGARIGWEESVIRNLLRYIDSFAFYLVAAISVWSSSFRQRLGDRAAGTAVIRVVRVPLTPPLPATPAMPAQPLGSAT